LQQVIDPRPVSATDMTEDFNYILYYQVVRLSQDQRSQKQGGHQAHFIEPIINFSKFFARASEKASQLRRESRTIILPKVPY
jgi:hypothetical protein